MRRRIKWFTVFWPILSLFAFTVNVILLKRNNQIAFSDKLVSKSRVLPRSLDAIWQRVPNTSDNIYVYSAFLEQRQIERKHFFSPPVIRMIGVTKNRKQNFGENGLNFEIVCRFCKVDVVKGVIEYIRENWKLSYTATFIFCPLRADGKIPTSVSLYGSDEVAQSQKKDPVILPTALNRVRVHQSLSQETSEDAALAACVKPIHYKFGKIWEVIEWIEFNRLLGVSHFYFYNHTMSANLTCVLEDYISQGLVTVLDWNGPPLVSQKQIRTENMFASLNDCLYRGMHKHKYLAFLDFDEYLMPKKHDTLTELLQDIETQGANFSSILFRNAFFYLQWPDDGDALNSQLVTMKKTRRKKYLHSTRKRSKYICKPEKVVEVGNHFVWESRSPQMKQLTLGLDEGFLHHYRICEFGGNGCVAQESEIDRTTWKWKTDLNSAVDIVQQKLEGVCDLAPINLIFEDAHD